jgi:protein phosphatase
MRPRDATPETLDDLALVWPPDGAEADASTRVRVDAGALSHPGLTLSQNDDYFVMGRFERSMETLGTNLPPGTIPARHREVVFGMLVADGIGGSTAAEIGSRTAAATLVDLVVGTPDWIMRLNQDFRQRAQRRFAARMRWLDRMLSQQAREIPGLRSMGAMMTVAASLGSDLILSHVGDSRAYQLRQGTLIQLTHDHNWARSLADAGVIDEGDIASHPKRRVLTRALGMEDGQVEVEVEHVRLADGDQILLCTDGLTDVLAHAAIVDTLQSARTAAEAAESLVGLALKAGAQDNVTAVVARYEISA